MPELNIEQPSQAAERADASLGANFELTKPAEAAPIENTAPTPNLPVLPNLPAPQNETLVLQRVENILAKDLDNIYLTLDAGAQANFRATGEKTARDISTLLSRANATLGQIVALIVSWLRLIPHINRHFVEQEAKIKADEIMRIKSGQNI